MLIQTEDIRKVVFKVIDGKAARIEVETGISDNTHIQITMGISAGDEIIIGGYRVLSRTLSDGDLLEVKNRSNNMEKIMQHPVIQISDITRFYQMGIQP